MSNSFFGGIQITVALKAPNIFTGILLAVQIVTDTGS